VESDQFEFKEEKKHKLSRESSSVVGVLLIGGLNSDLPLTVATTDSVSLFSDHVCRTPKSYPLETFGSFGHVDREGQPVVCGGTVIGGGVTR
jgi:hypothetical protein